MDDEFDAYDLSEFSTADFAHIDATTTREHDDDRHAATTSSTPVVVASDSAGARVRVDTSTYGSGGPQIAVALEPAADEFVIVKVARGGSGSSGDDVVGTPSKAETPTHSPFEMHRLRGTLSVSDLVGPAWYVLGIFFCLYVNEIHRCFARRCEVQFDYRLRQGRSLPLAERPDSFVSAEGKVITVEKKVAQVNEEVLEHGRVRIIFRTS